MTSRDRDPEPGRNVEAGDLIERVRDASRLPAPWRRRQIREDAAVSQRELAGALEVNVMTLNYWERGIAKPRGRNAARYARLLDQLAEATGEAHR